MRFNTRLVGKLLSRAFFSAGVQYLISWFSAWNPIGPSTDSTGLRLSSASGPRTSIVVTRRPIAARYTGIMCRASTPAVKRTAPAKIMLGSRMST
jgi:hypothetical protein